jgi:hypothetical protein
VSDVLLLTAKIFSIVLAFIAITKSYVDFRAKLESLQIFLFWLVTWMGIVILALFPEIVDVLLASFGGGRSGLGTFFGMALVFLFFIVYRIYVKLERIEQSLTKAIQELALRDQWMPKQSTDSTHPQISSD